MPTACGPSPRPPLDPEIYEYQVPSRRSDPPRPHHPRRHRQPQLPARQLPRSSRRRTRAMGRHRRPSRRNHTATSTPLTSPSASSATRATTSSTRRPGYDPTAKKTYPVLYLLHGWGDMAVGWTDKGRANFILDNLIAAGQGQAHDRCYAARLWRHCLRQRLEPSGAAMSPSTTTSALYYQRPSSPRSFPASRSEYRVSKDRERPGHRWPLHGRPRSPLDRPSQHRQVRLHRLGLALQSIAPHSSRACRS